MRLLHQEKIKIGAKYLGCTTKICLFPYTETVEAPIFSAGRALLVANATVENKEDSITVTTEADSIESQLAERIASGALSFSLILILSFFGGVFDKFDSMRISNDTNYDKGSSRTS